MRPILVSFIVTIQAKEKAKAEVYLLLQPQMDQATNIR
jgi:hypothetical protein